MLECLYPRYLPVDDDITELERECWIDLRPYMNEAPSIINEHSVVTQAYQMFRLSVAFLSDCFTPTPFVYLSANAHIAHDFPFFTHPRYLSMSSFDPFATNLALHIMHVNCND